MTTITQILVIINYCGHIYPQSQRDLLSLGLTKLDISDLCLNVVQGSLSTYTVYMRGTELLCATSQFIHFFPSTFFQTLEGTES